MIFNDLKTKDFFCQKVDYRVKIVIFAKYLFELQTVKNSKRRLQKLFLFGRKSEERCYFCQKNDSRSDFHEIPNIMKKLILTPQKDTFTICLPHDWVGRPLVCILRHPEEKGAYPEDSEFVSEVREEKIGYNASRYRVFRKPRRKRLRRKRGGRNRYL